MSSLHEFLTSASRLGRFTLRERASGTHWMGGPRSWSVHGGDYLLEFVWEKTSL